jgi:hypothetical protein
VDGYAGRAAEEVRAELASRGLLPRLAYDGAGYPVGTVSGVDPGGDVDVGSEVVVHVVPPPESPSEPVVGPGSAAPDTTAPDTTAPDTTAPDTTAPDTAAPAAGSTPADAPAPQEKGNGTATEPGPEKVADKDADKDADKGPDKAERAGAKQGGGGRGRSDG